MPNDTVSVIAKAATSGLPPRGHGPLAIDPRDGRKGDFTNRVFHGSSSTAYQPIVMPMATSNRNQKRDRTWLLPAAAGAGAALLGGRSLQLLSDVQGFSAHSSTAQTVTALLTGLSVAGLAGSAGLIAVGGRRNRTRSQVLLEHIRDVVFVIENDTVIEALPRESMRLGYSISAAVGSSIVSALPCDEDQLVQKLLFDARENPGVPQKRSNVAATTSLGVLRSYDLTATAEKSGVRAPVTLTVHEVTDRQSLRTAMAEQGATDLVTGMANRFRFLEVVDAEMHRARRNGKHLAILYGNIDGFRHVNEAFGQSAGDAVLRELAARLKDTVRVEDVVGRIAADEFAVLLAGLEPGAGRGYAVDVVDRISEKCGLPIRANGHDVTVTMSVGVAHRADAEPATPQDLVEEARTNMQEVKTNSRRWRDLKTGA